MSRVVVAEGRGGMGRDRVEDDGAGRQGNDGHDEVLGDFVLPSYGGGRRINTDVLSVAESSLSDYKTHIYS